MGNDRLGRHQNSKDSGTHTQAHSVPESALSLQDRLHPRSGLHTQPGGILTCLSIGTTDPGSIPLSTSYPFVAGASGSCIGTGLGGEVGDVAAEALDKLSEQELKKLFKFDFGSSILTNIAIGPIVIHKHCIRFQVEGLS